MAGKQPTKVNPERVRRRFTGTTKIFGGTGAFSKVRGVVSNVVEFDTDSKNGYNRSANKGKYWFID